MVRRKLSRSRFEASRSSVHNVTDKNSNTSNVSKKKSKSKIKHGVLVGSKMFTVSVKTMREVRRLQLTTALLIPKMSFARVVREVLAEYGADIRVQKATLEALQEAAEAYLVQLFEDSYLCALHSRRITLLPRDIQLTLRLRGGWEYVDNQR